MTHNLIAPSPSVSPLNGFVIDAFQTVIFALAGFLVLASFAIA